MKILAIIPARGGSQRLKNKNILPLCGKPLVAYTIESAQKSGLFDKVILSTDSEKIANIGKNFLKISKKCHKIKHSFERFHGDLSKYISYYFSVGLNILIEKFKKQIKLPKK